MGADFVDVDVRATANEIPVIARDDSLARVCGVEGLISQLTLADVQARSAYSAFTWISRC
jgi:glycerophosphoryl diester phosphodiesterase